MNEVCDTFLSQLSYLPHTEAIDVKRAFDLARLEHGEERRKSGELFFTHPVTVASYLADYHADSPTLIAALLHDVAEDTTVSVKEIENRFGPEVAHIVNGVTKFDRVTAKARLGRELSKAELQRATLYKLFETMAADLRVGVVKIFDRLHNMRTIQALPYRKQSEKARESMLVYAPLANKLGMWRIKNQLECLSLSVLFPDRFRKFQDALNARKKSYRITFPELKSDLRHALREADIAPISIIDAPDDISEGFDIWQSEQEARISDAPPSIVILLDKEIDCYTALGHIHAHWRPVAGKFDDYIAARRHNLYRSLHTTVIYKGRRVKVRIRTLSMQIESQDGILSHWTDSKAVSAWPDDAKQKVDSLFHQFQNGVSEDVRDFDDRVQHILDDVFKNQIIVYSPKGKMIELPKGATPVDFAYQIHTEIGHSCRGVLVNGERQPLTHVLQDGDSVFIDRHGQSPPLAWLDEDLGYVHTRTARLAIRRWFRRLPKEIAIEKGRYLLEMELRAIQLEMTPHEDIAQLCRYPSTDKLYLAIGRADLSPSKMATQILTAIWEQNESESGESLNGQAIFTDEGDLYIIENAGERALHRCKTCKPRPGDKIVGFIRKDNKVTVHSEGCRLLAPDEIRGRCLKLRWGEEMQNADLTRHVSFQILAYDRDGLIHEITQIIKDDSINISMLWSHVINFQATIVFSAEMRTPYQVIRFLHRVQEMKNVIYAYYLGRTSEEHIIPERFFATAQV